jgi:restriction system protein
MTREYRRIMPGPKGKYASICREQGFIGGDWGFDFDISDHLVDDWRQFNQVMRPVYLESHPEKSKISAGLACGMLHTICKGMPTGSVVLSPDGTGSYMVGEVTGEYLFQPGEVLPHRRPVRWYEQTISRDSMSAPLQNSAGSITTLSNLTKYHQELELLIRGNRPSQIIVTEEAVEDPAVFALEKHLEDFLVKNWNSTDLGKDYDIFQDDGEIIGQQFPSDTGPIDILAVKKDRTELLVVELKKGRASDVVVGQIQRYMGYVVEELAEEHQTVKGIIIALEDDLRLRRALRVAPNIDFYRYKIDFQLIKG